MGARLRGVLAATAEPFPTTCHWLRGKFAQRIEWYTSSNIQGVPHVPRRVTSFWLDVIYGRAADTPRCLAFAIFLQISWRFHFLHLDTYIGLLSLNLRLFENFEILIHFFFFFFFVTSVLSLCWDDWDSHQISRWNWSEIFILKLGYSNWNLEGNLIYGGLRKHWNTYYGRTFVYVCHLCYMKHFEILLTTNNNETQLSWLVKSKIKLKMCI